MEYPATESNEFEGAPGTLERSAIVDLQAVRHNVEKFVATAFPAALMAVVKADAYGHGAIPVARVALDAGAQWLGVAHISEAQKLRAAGIRCPILAWLHTPRSEFSSAIELGIDIGVSGWEISYLIAAVHKIGKPARVHLKVDTGMGRNGATPDQWLDVVRLSRQLQDQGLIQIVGIFSHLAVADEPYRAETDDQLATFQKALQIAQREGIHPDLRHLANTAATLTRQDSHLDMVRIGLGIYGLSPFKEVPPRAYNLRPAMTLRTVIANAKIVPAGQGVSYGLTHQTSRETILGLVPLGYGDGIPRTAEGGRVNIKGKTYGVVGRIAMDQMVVDLGPPLSADGAGSFLGAETVVFGGADGPTAGNWAKAAGTINYEVVTKISPRVPRIYTK